MRRSAAVTVKSGDPVTDTRSVLLFGNPTTASRARPPAETDAGEAITPGTRGAACSTATASPPRT